MVRCVNNSPGGVATDFYLTGSSLSLQVSKMHRICTWSWTTCQAATFLAF